MPTTPLELPAPIAGLEKLAYNLRWTWWREKWSLFRWLDPEAWVRTHHNPVRVLAELPRSRLEEAANDPGYVERVRLAVDDLHAYLASRGQAEPRRIAYFSAEFALTDCIRVFSGGLGVLAGDHLKSASDLGLPLAAVGLLYHDGYFHQYIDANGWQHESYRRLEPTMLPLIAETARDGSALVIGVEFPGRMVYARVWRADVGAIPLYLLDTNFDANAPDDRHITDRLYGGDLEHRLKQELILGIGGVRVLEALEHPIEVVHMNEGHAAFAVVEHLRMALERDGFVDAAIAAVADRMVFTTHTPVEAGHDWFPAELMHRYFAERTAAMGLAWDRFLSLGLTTEPGRDGQFCMTALALRVSRARNGVSKPHGQVSRAMWRNLFNANSVDEVPIDHITNGVHLPSWVGARMARLYSEYIAPDWRERSGTVDWSRAATIPADRLWQARQEQRARLVDRLNAALAAQARMRGTPEDAVKLNPEALTITFARRFATYKRATLLLTDTARLARIVGDPERPVQIVFAGKAHPRDEPGKLFLQQVFQLGRRPEFTGRVVFIENYDVELARHMVQGSDVWLNVPRRPLEASGTSGMKAAANGGLNLSVGDGWWAEAWFEHNRWYAPIGFLIEPSGLPGPQDATDAEVLYRLLENEIVPLFYLRNAAGIPMAWVDRMRAAIAQVCAFFNTDRMVSEYVERFYRLKRGTYKGASAAAFVGSSEGYGG